MIDGSAGIDGSAARQDFRAVQSQPACRRLIGIADRYAMTGGGVGVVG